MIILKNNKNNNSINLFKNIFFLNILLTETELKFVLSGGNNTCGTKYPKLTTKMKLSVLKPNIKQFNLSTEATQHDISQTNLQQFSTDSNLKFNKDNTSSICGGMLINKPTGLTLVTSQNKYSDVKWNKSAAEQQCRKNPGNHNQISAVQMILDIDKLPNSKTAIESLTQKIEMSSAFVQKKEKKAEFIRAFEKQRGGEHRWDPIMHGPIIPPVRRRCTMCKKYIPNHEAHWVYATTPKTYVHQVCPTTGVQSRGPCYLVCKKY